MFSGDFYVVIEDFTDFGDLQGKYVKTLAGKGLSSLAMVFVRICKSAHLPVT